MSRRCDEKRLRALMRERVRLQAVLWEAPLVELEQPFQRGWLREFRLTDRAKRRENADQLCRLLKVVNHRQYCRRGDFTTWCGEKKRRRPAEHGLRRPHLWQLLREGVDPKLFKYFRHIGSGAVVSRAHLQYWIGRRWNGRLEVVCPEYFSRIIKPWIITHQKVDLPEARARLAEIDACLEAENGWERWLRLRGCGVSARSGWDGPSPVEKRVKVEDAEICAYLQLEPPPTSEFYSGKAMKKGTTNVVLFDFPTLSLTSHLSIAA